MATAPPRHAPCAVLGRRAAARRARSAGAGAGGVFCGRRGPTQTCSPTHPPRAEDPKFVYYLSAEFLQGRSLLNAILNLGIKVGAGPRGRPAASFASGAAVGCAYPLAPAWIAAAWRRARRLRDAGPSTRPAQRHIGAGQSPDAPPPTDALRLAQGEYADALRALGTTLEEAVEQEHNAALGNGGLGRLVSGGPRCRARALRAGARLRCRRSAAQPPGCWRLCKAAVRGRAAAAPGAPRSSAARLLCRAPPKPQRHTS